MADVTARFGADFSKFTTAVQGASVKLKDFEGDAKKVSDTVQRIGDRFDGRKIIQDAEMAAQAINKIGGASTLTEAEQKKLNAQVTEAIAKYKALGQAAPKALTDLADATKKVEKSTGGIGSVMSSTFGQFTAANLASTAISKVTDELARFVAQGLKLGPMETAFANLATSVGQDAKTMQAAMATGTKGLVSDFDLIQSANKALLLGLPATSTEMGELAEIATKLGRAMGKDATASLNEFVEAVGKGSPEILNNFGIIVKAEDAYQKYAATLHKKVDQLTAAERQMAVYTDAMEKARAKAKELGDETKTLGELATTAWIKVENAVTTAASGINTSVGSALSSMKGFKAFLVDLSASGGDWATAIALGANRVAAEGAKRRPDVDLTPPKPPVDPAAEAAAKKAAEALRQYREEITRLSDAMRGLDKITDARKAMEAFAQAQRAGLTVAKLSADQLESLNETILEGVAAHQRMGTAVPPAWIAMAQATTSATLQAKIEVISLTQTLEKLKDVTLAIPKAAQALVPALNVIKGFGTGAVPGTALGPLTLPKGPGLFDQLLGDPAKLGASMSSAILGAIQGGGSPVAAAAGTAGQAIGTSVAKSLSGSLLKDGAGMFSKALGGVISSALPIIGSLVGPLADMLMDKLFGTKGRDNVVKFAESLGGFDALHVQLNQLGAEGEKLWIKLTQGTGRNNPEEAAKNIKLVTDALAAYEKKQADAGAAAEAAAEKEISAADKVRDAMQKTLDDLDAQMTSLQQSIANEAAEDVMGIVESQTRAQIAAIAEQRVAAQRAIDETAADAAAAAEEAANVIDAALAARKYQIDVAVNLTGLPSGTTIPTEPTLPPGTPVAPANSGWGGGGTAILQVDGKTLAEAVVPAMPGVITKYGLARS